VQLNKNLARLFIILAAAGCITYSIATLKFTPKSMAFETIALQDAQARETKSPLGQLRVLSRCVAYLRTNYVAPSRIKPVPMLLGALKAAEAMIPDLMATEANNDPDLVTSVVVQIGEHSKRFALKNISDLYQMTWTLMDIFGYIGAYLPVEVKPEDVEYAAINGLLTPLDEHSAFLPPKAYEEMKLDTEGRFGGLGIVITIRNGLVTVVSVLPGTPAERAGLRSLDQITDIGDETTLNMPLTEAVSKLRGEPGTDVTIQVFRKGWAEPRPFTLRRAEIHVESVSSEVLGHGVGYVKIRQFQEDTSDELSKHLNKLKSQGALRALVLDLRQNPGGLLEQAVQTARLYIKNGTIVVTQGRGNEMFEQYEARGKAPFASVPIVVLVDAGSASAAEILAAALKDNDRAILLGDTTFGKGTVQVLYEVGGGALKLTVAQYLTPKGLSIHTVGITPDIDTIPVVIGKDKMTLGTLEQREERDERRKLEPLGPVPDDTPLFHLPVFQEGDEEEQSEEEEPPIREDKFQRDDVINAAESIAHAISSDKFGSKGFSRQEALNLAKAQVEELIKKQDERIVERLKGFGIDWSDGPVQPYPTIDVSWHADKAQPFVAGSEVTLTLKAKNLGSSPLYRVHCTTQSANPAFDYKEFIFGRIDPGQAVSRQAVIKIPTYSWDRSDMLEFVVFQSDTETQRLKGTMFAVQSASRPRFAYVYQVDDEQGDGDGVLTLGETANLVVDVLNQGSGAVRDLLVTLRNKSGEGIYVKKGRKTFKEGLQVGRLATAKFEIEVRPTFASDVAKFEVGIMDTKLREFMSETIELPVRKKGRLERKLGVPLQLVSEDASSKGCSVLILSAARDDARPLYSVPCGAYVRGAGAFDDYYKVEIEPGRFGFVQRKNANEVSGIVRFAELPQIPMFLNAMPELRVSFTKGDVDANCPQDLKISGIAHFDVRYGIGDRRKVMIFKGTDKVFFFGSASADSLEVPFDTTTTLDKGLNDFAVYAIDGKDRATVRRFSISCEKAKGVVRANGE
jgi:carboxyl-terminal processing protease